MPFALITLIANRMVPPESREPNTQVVLFREINPHQFYLFLINILSLFLSSTVPRSSFRQPLDFATCVISLSLFFNSPHSYLDSPEYCKTVISPCSTSCFPFGFTLFLHAWLEHRSGPPATLCLFHAELYCTMSSEFLTALLRQNTLYSKQKELFSYSPKML